MFSSFKIDYTDYQKSLICRINEVYVISIKYRYCDILLKKNINFIYNRLFCCNHTCDCVNMVPVTSSSRYITSASHYHTRYQSRSSMYIRGLIPRNWPWQFRLVCNHLAEEERTGCFTLFLWMHVFSVYSSLYHRPFFISTFEQ